MKDYTKYKKCERCGGYDIPDEELPSYERYGIKRYDYSMRCNGVLTLGTDPFAEEIYGDFTESWDCEGSRYQSAMDI